jgi:HAD superfamily hydrolase (TIGR01549 family)
MSINLLWVSGRHRRDVPVGYAAPEPFPGTMGPMSDPTDHSGFPEPPSPALLFDLDGTLVDSVYQHVIAWRSALADVGIDLAVWRIHRRIGMSGGLFVSALLRETGVDLDDAEIERVQRLHAERYREQADTVRPLPGASELLARLTDREVPWAIATSGRRETAESAFASLGLTADAPIVTRDMVRFAKPDPDLFLAAAGLLGVDPRHTMVVGDSVWDLLAARRAGALGIGVMSGGYGRDELERAGAYRVYADPADMAERLDELGLRRTF